MKKWEDIKTAEELMRARYQAYVDADIEFIKVTHDPETIHAVSWEETEKWSKNSEWLGLEIINIEDGTENDEDGLVEFKATYMENGKEVVHHEKSLFVKKDGKWYYRQWLPLQETIVKENKVGRNDLCVCGSGKKYKKCCGKK
ncbi:SEC-C domain-containing protein [Cetobacterium sp. 2A]|uniref:YchJ family protein n=1 Tax=Cetobacterium sp. 2A TaxID=2754723 RepID=UPI00163CEF13|nr:YchJ family metal-binding protein [Cetobacterium sp. 2A]MBC2857309.1 SEC-C domain-containing protein [Cetobacterium sp. 2A]